MKKVILSLVLAAFAFTASAQNTEKTRWPGHTTNKFWHNWEISAGAGVGTAFRDGTGSTEGAFGKRLGVTGQFSVTKWFHPIIGARLELQGGQFSNFRHFANGVHLNPDNQGPAIKWPYLFAHADAMINLSNWLGGYREDRVYYAVPFLGFGYQATCFTDNFQQNNPGNGTRNDFAATVGLLNKFRVCKQIDINLEFKYWFYHENDMPLYVHCNGRTGHAAAVTAGITYRFNKRGWDKAYTKADFQKYIDEAAAMRDQLAAANAARAAAEEAAAKAKSEAERAAARAAAAEAEAAAAAARAAAAAKGVFADGNSIFFNIGSAKLTSTDKVRLSLIADQIKNSDAVFTINGYADKKTGTANINKRVSENRAKNVYDYLVSCGVSKDKLKYASYGDTVQPYGEGANYKANRAAIIEK